MKLGLMVLLCSSLGCGASLAPQPEDSLKQSLRDVAQLALPSADTGPISQEQVDLFKSLGFVGAFQIGVMGSNTFAGDITMRHRAQRSDTLEWSSTKQSAIRVDENIGEALTLPTERLVYPAFLIRHEFSLLLPSGGGLMLAVARGGALVKFLERKPDEQFAIVLSFAEPNETAGKHAGSQFLVSWTQSVPDPKTGERKEYQASTNFPREKGDQLWLRHKNGEIEVFCQLLAPKQSEEGELIIPNLVKMVIKRVDPPEKPQPKPTGGTTASIQTD
ncbi:hypothetical protein HYZ64_01455 [Candidatus Berkelbacteria bacterium]|nr:hypothetical protein [Candidatus Berkelbacteria bacterium]